jgi:hypothetical protein
MNTNNDFESLKKIYKNQLSDFKLNKKYNKKNLRRYYRLPKAFQMQITESSKKKSYDEGAESYWEGILKKIIDANPELSKECISSQIVQIESDKPTSRVSKTLSRPIIFVDTGTMKFLWVMNKSVLYGHESGKYTKNYMICITLLMYASWLYPPNRATTKIQEFITPDTPPHPSKDLFRSLFELTYIQEMFLIAHEVAHLELGHIDGRHSNIEIREEALAFASGQTLQNEIASDELAAKLCLNAISHDEASTRIVLSDIFLLFRYFMWLELVTNPKRHKESLWAARQSQFRNTIRNLYHWGPPIFIAEQIDWLEMNMEIGAMTAVTAYETACEEQRGV